MEKLIELVEKEMITLEEIEIIENVTVVHNGNSGLHVGYQWYSVYTDNGEFDVYVK